MSAGDLAALFARAAANRERQREQPSSRDLAITVDAPAVLAIIEPADRVFNPGQGFGPHLKERSIKLLPGIRIGKVAEIPDRIGWSGAALTETAVDVAD